MNRALHLNPASLALGLVFGGICLLSMSQASVVSSPLRVEYMPHPRDMVQIHEGVPYLVPAGKLFVVSALGAAGSLSQTSFIVNGQFEFSTTATSSYTTIGTVPSGFAVPAGSTITVSGGGSGRAWGYLAPQ
jgi:hypothetical protein